MTFDDHPAAMKAKIAFVGDAHGLWNARDEEALRFLDAGVQDGLSETHGDSATRMGRTLCMHT